MDLINRSENRPLLSPLDGIPKDYLENDKDYEFRKMTVRGKFDHSRELYIVPRSFISSEEFNPLKSRENQPMVAKMRVGVNVVTPFILDDGRKILGRD